MKRLTTSSALQNIKTLIHQNLYKQALKAIISLRTPHLTSPTLSLLIKSGGSFFPLHPFLSASLITHFSLSGDLSTATHLLHQTHHPDVVVFNSLISGYARFNQPEPVFDLFNTLRHLGLYPDVYTLSSLIKACDGLTQNEIAHGVSLKMGLVSSVFLISGLVENYFKCGFVGSAERCFEECLVLDCVVLTSMINGYVWNGEFEKARGVFRDGRGVLDLELNEFSFTSVVGAVFDVREGEQIHGFCVKIGFLCGWSTHLNNAVMNVYGRCGCNFDAVKVFDEMPDPDVVSWTERIGVAYDGVEALEVFKFCLSIGLDVNEYTMIKILSAIEANMLNLGKQIHTFCYKAGFLFVVSVCNALISVYGNSGQMSDARRVFNEMSFQDSVSWNSLIAVYSQNGLANQAVEMLSHMRDSLLRPDEYTLASILEVVSNSNSPERTMQIHALMIKFGFISDDSMLSCLITAYGKCSGIEESKRVFSEIDKVDVVHLRSMAASFAYAGCHIDVLKLLQTRLDLSLEVDSLTFSIALKACGVLTDLELARTIQSLALKCGIDMDGFIESAIIDIYCKCGSIDDAAKAFRNIANGNLAAWNAMIMGYAQSGCYSNVCELFRRMCDCRMKPDEITYLGVLSSCCHAGLVNEAHYHLNSMFELHDVIPRLEHYACVVDVLGRVGLLEDAKKTIDQMPIDPDAQIWQVLLASCNIHGNVDLGKVAARKLLELQPENDSAFVLLSNLYASASMWNAVGELRREMKEKIVFKEPGSSWIQVRGSIHYFFADDASHPESEGVYLRLKSLKKQMVEWPEADQDGISFNESMSNKAWNFL